MTSLPDQALEKQRNSRLLRGIGTSLLARGASVIAPLVLIPVSLNYMGAASYAIWMSAASLTAMAVFADLGLGQGLMTVLTPLLVREDTASARRAISTTYLLLSAVAVVGCVGILLASQVVDWTDVLGVDEGSPTDSWIATACLLSFVLNVPLSLILRIQYAAQMVGSANLWQASGPVMSLCLASIAVGADLGSVAVVIGALCGPLMANLAATVWFYRNREGLRPSLAYASRGDIRILSSMGAGFLVLNVVMAISTNIDVVLVSHYDSAAAVVAFAVAMRLFTQIGSLVSLVNVPLWPANAEAIARGDYSWVRRSTRVMALASTMLTATAAGLLVVGGSALFEAWTDTPMDLPRVLLVGAALWWILLAGLSPLFMVQNSVGVLVPQLVGWSTFLVVAIPAKVWVLDEFGKEWIPMVGFAIALATVAPGCVVGYRRAMRGAHRTPPERSSP